jgi:hypothetical protein
MPAMKNIGILLTAIWLIATGVIQIIHLSFAGLPVIMAGLAIAAGIFLILRR